MKSGVRKISKALLMVVMVAMAVVVGCDTSTTDGVDREQVDTDTDEYHSPFIISGTGELEFETISFTDVGLKSGGGEPAEPFLLETVAQSLAYELTAHGEMDYEAKVEYEEDLVDPGNHLYCDSDHLYVALWRGHDPDRWGYSLWSGCHERQKFQWKEIEDPYGDDVDAVTWVEPLTESIIDSILDAHEEQCFVAKC